MQRIMTRPRRLVIRPSIGEQEAAYYLALRLVQGIDGALEHGIYFRTRAGNLLTTLDEVVCALLADDLGVLV